MHLVSVLIGTALVIASACVFNNYIDRCIDAKMDRTKRRALVSGRISTISALSYASLLGIVGLAVLVSGTNWLTVGLGLLAFFVYVVVYGIAKRRTVHSTVIGSIAGAIPPVAGYTAMSNRLDGGAVLLFLILVCWQMPHFYAIAMYRYKDYKAAGLPILTVKKGMRAAKLQILFYVVAFGISASLLTIFGYTGYIYLLVILGLSLNWLRLGLAGLKTKDDEKWARKMFFYSLIVTLSLSFMLAVGGLLP